MYFLRAPNSFKQSLELNRFGFSLVPTSWQLVFLKFVWRCVLFLYFEIILYNIWQYSNKDQELTHLNNEKLFLDKH